MAKNKIFWRRTDWDKFEPPSLIDVIKLSGTDDGMWHGQIKPRPIHDNPWSSSATGAVQLSATNAVASSHPACADTWPDGPHFSSHAALLIPSFLLSTDQTIESICNQVLTLSIF